MLRLLTSQLSAEQRELGDGRVLMLGLGRLQASLLLFVLLLLIGLLGWANLAVIEAAAVARGKVTVESRPKTIQHLEGGIVRQIWINDGQYVEAGDRLISLESAAARSQLNRMVARWQSHLARANRLQAELAGAETILFSDALLKQQADARVAVLMQTQQQLMMQRMALFKGERALLDQEASNHLSRQKALHSKLAADQKSLHYLQQQIAMHLTLLAQGSTSKSRLLDLKREAARLASVIAETNTDIVTAEGDLAETKLHLANIHHDQTQRIAEEMQQVEAALYELEETMLEAEDRLSRIDIVAPQSGRVADLKVLSSGEVIAPGQPLLQIVPQQEAFIVEAFASPQDIDVIQQGMKTRVRLTALDQRTALPINGEVIHVAANQTEQDNEQAGYLIKVRLFKEEIDTEVHRALYQGMPAEVMVLLGNRTPMDYLLDPLYVTAYKAMREH
ncbi:HlyD family type I secretion periplasmic adaptor subunit [Thaumasiovibrio subtropicus]|uniref:HlyD family type I secretion periplasmic adaptor subunit n=1 Tax=Thaumasiovibrio subtropicus TaxID=1891207 RepID=UPI00131D9430|nr:HlyD family type I secretion periplasmic adaptor subunit [Thaumasiovibrio subtropicus]